MDEPRNKTSYYQAKKKRLSIEVSDRLRSENKSSWAFVWGAGDEQWARSDSDGSTSSRNQASTFRGSVETVCA